MNGDIVIIKGCLVTPGRPTGPGWLELRGGVISRVGSGDYVPPGGRLPDGRPPDGQMLDFGANWVCPGFIDLHVHGGAGYDLMDGTPAAVGAVAQFHARGGTTAFLGVTMSAGRSRLKQVLAAAAEYRRRQSQAGATMPGAMPGAVPGAVMLGIHLEGPYLNPVKKGAHAPGELKLPDLQEMQELLAEAGDLIKMVTLAPELPGGQEMIAFLTRRQVKTALGHSAANYDDLAGAAAGGLSHVTHMFNAMGELRHREPGTAGYLLEMPAITADVIADGVHVHPMIIRLLLKLKGIDKTVLITDATRAAGLTDGCFELGGQKIWVQDGAARLADGTLAGSTLTMNRAVAYMVQEVGIPVEAAVQMAAGNPAGVLGLDGIYGKLEAGYKGNVTVMDRKFGVAAVFVEGNRVG